MSDHKWSDLPTRGPVYDGETWTSSVPMTGRCGARRPNIIGKPGRPPLEHCRLPHGHAGWHLGDDGSEWSPAPPRAPRLNRHEAARIASSAIASYAARNTNLSYDGMADAVVTAYVDLAVLSVLDTDDVAAQRREDAEYRALDRDQAEVDRERGAA